MGSSQPRFSIVVPLHNGERYVAECCESVLEQDFDDLELLLVDDCSTDGTVKVAQELCDKDARVRLIKRTSNGGTLRARRDGVLATRGECVLLLDQDDAFCEGALVQIDAALCVHDVDILHFSARVVSEGEAASGAAVGMQSFLTPPARTLSGADILATQFAEKNGFDWHVHHKAFRGELARRAWAVAEDVELVLSDDLYVSFILCSMAQSYAAVGNSGWYEYHLGRGETFGSVPTLNSFRLLCERDRKGFALVTSYAERAAGEIVRDDWDARVSDVRDRLIEHVMNEFHDNVPAEFHDEALEIVVGMWPADAVAGELWRFVRDRAYALFDTGQQPASDDELFGLIADAEQVDALVEVAGSLRYQTMRATAERHLCDLGLRESALQQQHDEVDSDSSEESRRTLRSFLKRLRRRI